MSFLNSPVIASITRELDVCALRHEAYSANIANANVQGYERVEVKKLAVTDTGSKATTPAQMVATHDSVKLDQELARLSKNALRYETLLTAYQQTAGILSLAIKDGRGA
jgi:flagellar basal body rod protein FlgB